MSHISNIQQLNEAILIKERALFESEFLLKQQFKDTYDSLNTVTFIRNAFKELVTAPDFKHDLLNTSISLAVGYFSKKLAVGNTNNPIKQTLGNFLQLIVTGIVSKNSNDIRTKLTDIINVIMDKKPK
jgi:hypothetical protein